MSALFHPLAIPDPSAPLRRAGVRFGITVSRRQARRAVARNAVKRVIREAARHASGALEPLCGQLAVEVLFRLKAPLPEPSAASWAQMKRDLRHEADGLLGQLQAQLRKGPPVARPAHVPVQTLAQSAGPAGPAEA